MLKKSIQKDGYRADIDGLRALAVTAVFLHHLNTNFLPGGYVGVDIFFVISGYLITRQIEAEIRDGTFSISSFYKRRINRIIPALFTVIATSAIIGWFVLSPVDLTRFAKSAVSAIGGFSNIFFWKEYGSYFSPHVDEAVLLHTWSLGVEEQFYVIWPLLLIAVLHIHTKIRKVILGAIFCLAFFLSAWFVTIAPSPSYYLLPTRFFELMIGGMLALLAVRLKPSSAEGATAQSAIGLLLIFGSMAFLDKTSAFPGVNAMWPCLGAALLIWSGRTNNRLLFVLANRPTVFVGLVSYSLYLWHWPLISYANYLNIDITTSAGAAIVILALVLAILTWRYIEGPFRKSGYILTFKTVALRRFVLPSIMLIAGATATFLAAGFPNRFDEHVAEFERITETQPQRLRSGCHVQARLQASSLGLEKCRLGVLDAEIDGVLIGDSYANHFTGMMDELSIIQGIALADHTLDACPPILGYETKDKFYASPCKTRNEANYRMIADRKFKNVVLAGHWPDDIEVGRKMIDSVKKILTSGAKVTIILSNQVIKGASTCATRNFMYHISANCSAKQEDAPAYIAEVIATFPSVHLIDPNTVMCLNRICQTVLEDVPLYRDDGHLNDVGSRLIGRSLAKLGVTALPISEK